MLATLSQIFACCMSIQDNIQQRIFSKSTSFYYSLLYFLYVLISYLRKQVGICQKFGQICANNALFLLSHFKQTQYSFILNYCLNTKKLMKIPKKEQTFLSFQDCLCKSMKCTVKVNKQLLNLSCCWSIPKIVSLWRQILLLRQLLPPKIYQYLYNSVATVPYLV